MVRIKIFLYAILFVVYVALYRFAPLTYDYEYCLLIFCLFLVSFVLFFVFKQKKNYFDFDTLFLIAGLFIHFIYPVFLYPIDPHFFVMFSFEFDQNLITKGTALAALGLHSYMLGSLTIPDQMNMPKVPFTPSVKIRYIATNHLQLILFPLFALLCVTLDKDFITDGYSGGPSGIAGYVLLLFMVCFTLYFIFTILDKDSVRVLKLRNLGAILILFVFMLFSIYIGTRSYILILGLLIFGLYTSYYRGMSLKVFIPCCIAGLVGMSIIGMMRSGGGVSFTSTADAIMDLVINCRTTFVALEYVSENNHTWGITMLGPFLASVPFLQSIVCSIFGISPISLTSSMFMTVLTLGENPPLGLGTNIIADLYLAFGAVGVVIGMFLLGRLIAFLLNRIYIDLYSSVAYFVILSQCLYMSRGEFFTPMRYLVWGFAIVILTRYLQKNNGYKA